MKNEKHTNVEYVHALWLDFENGDLEAGIELLNGFIYIHAQDRCAGYPLQKRIEDIIEALLDNNHPAGVYYSALMHLYDLIDIPMTNEEAICYGMDTMRDLILDGNSYAIEWLERKIA